MHHQCACKCAAPKNDRLLQPIVQRRWKTVDVEISSDCRLHPVAPSQSGRPASIRLMTNLHRRKVLGIDNFAFQPGKPGVSTARNTGVTAPEPSLRLRASLAHGLNAESVHTQHLFVDGSSAGKSWTDLDPPESARLFRFFLRRSKLMPVQMRRVMFTSAQAGLMRVHEHAAAPRDALE